MKEESRQEFDAWQARGAQEQARLPRTVRPFRVGVPAIRDHRTCHLCGLSHPHVEAGGVHHCPCGAAYWRRSNLASYKDVADGYTIDPEELIAKGLDYAANISDTALAEHIRASARHWL